MRTLCFTLSVALFPDAPSVQAAIGSIVLAVYVGRPVKSDYVQMGATPGCETCLWPWKVPVVNTADAVVTFALLVLLGHARQAGCFSEVAYGSQGADSEQDFSNGISMALLGSRELENCGLAEIGCGWMLIVTSALRCLAPVCEGAGSFGWAVMIRGSGC